MEASVGYYFVIKTEVKEDFVKEEVGNSFHGDGFLGGVENHPLSKPMVNHNQKCVKAGGGGKVGDEITENLLERAGGSGVNRSEGGNSGVGVGFVLLANHTLFNIFLHKRYKTRPPELGGN